MERMSDERLARRYAEREKWPTGSIYDETMDALLAERHYATTLEAERDEARGMVEVLAGAHADCDSCGAEADCPYAPDGADRPRVHATCREHRIEYARATYHANTEEETP